ncbi:MAG: L,D-transpeptidase/peptidoglycan binding protein [Clostridium sp.]|jgi:hypothetical protein|nr:L,D-transpeptidase/peptidoglycan binding protein [Clostridium sp.]
MKSPLFFVKPLGVLLFLLLYFGSVWYWKDHFLPNTYINGYNCSGMTLHEANVFLCERMMEYRLDVKGRGNIIIGRIAIAQLDATINFTPQLSNLMKKQANYAWIDAFWRKSTLQCEGNIQIERRDLRTMIESWSACLPENMQAPRNAAIAPFSPSEGTYKLIPETQGNLLDLDKVVEVLMQGIRRYETVIDLDMQHCYVSAELTEESPILRDSLKKLNTWITTSVVYDWNGQQIVVDANIIHEWIQVDEYNPAIDDGAILAFVFQTAQEYDTYGKMRRFVTAKGQEKVLPGGVFGWRTDVDAETNALIQLIEKGEHSIREPIYLHRGVVKGMNDIGNTYIEIDLSNQHLYQFEKGNLVFETDFVSGNMSNGQATPEGVYGLTYKTRDAILRGENYETPVQYWMPFNGNIGMHDATWRSEFGQSIYRTAGSHGCINLPLEAARKIYESISTGHPIICYY